MKEIFSISAIGHIDKHQEVYVLVLDPRFREGLAGTEGFSHLQVVWWAHLTDMPENRETLRAGKLFRNGPDEMGIFGTRAPFRPNPLMISTVRVLSVDMDKGIIHIPFIDAEPGSPLLDIKPYYPMERVKNCQAPDWCRHWPQWAEEASEFDWSKEINF